MKKISKLILGSAAIAIIGMSSCSRINVGNVGLKVNLTGSDKGVQDYKYVTGWAFYVPGFSQVVEYSTRYKTIEYPDYQVTCKGGTTFTSHPKLTYKINAALANKTFMAFGTDNMELIENGYIHNAITKALGDIANKFTPDSLLYSRERFEELSMSDMQGMCDSLGISITMFRANLTPSAAIAAAIDLKQASIQNSQRIQNEKASVIAEGEKTVAKAKLDAEALITMARAEAESNKLRMQTLTPLLLQQQYLEKWDGKLSTTSLGNNPVMLNIK